LHHVRAELGDELRVNWRFFPLDQVNSTEGPEWKLWEQPAKYRSRGRAAFLAAIAARKQGEEAFARFHFALLQAKHASSEDHGKRSVHMKAAREARLDMDVFERDLEDQAGMPQIGVDYEEARNRYGAFGTPTFVFPNGEAAYLKIHADAPAEEAVPFFREFVRTAAHRPHISEIKRPVKPDPVPA